MVLAKLRRMGRTPSEPVRGPRPGQWTVYPGGSDGAFEPNPHGDDKAYTFRSFSQGMRGSVTLDY